MATAVQRNSVNPFDFTPAPYGGTPTVPATAQDVSPDEIVPQQQTSWFNPTGSDVVDQSYQTPQMPAGMGILDALNNTPEYQNNQNFLDNYWAPDRDQVLASMGLSSPNPYHAQTVAGHTNPNDPSAPAPTYDAGFDPAPAVPWMGAPANNPTADPEMGYWGDFMGMHNMNFTPAQAKFEDFFQNYWAPDRSAVLASLRYGAPRTFDPSQASPTTGINGGGGAQQAQTQAAQTQAPLTWQSFSQAWMSSPYPGTVQGLQQFMAAHPEYAQAGITLGGSKGDKVYGPGGAYWGDFVQSAGQNGGIGKLGGGPDTGGSGSSGSISGSINDALLRALGGGQSPFQNSIQQSLLDIISGKGNTPNLTNQLIGARTDAARAMQSQLSDADAALAARGLASTPGVNQGAQVGAIERITNDVGANFANTIRDIETHGMDLANANELQALSLATGLSESQAQNLLSAIGLGTNRQTALASIALQQLSQSQDWNKFLLGYGLDQTKLANDISRGRIQDVTALLQIYLQGGATASQGHI